MKIALGGKNQSELQIADILGRQQWDLSRKDLEAVYIGKNFQKEEAEK